MISASGVGRLAIDSNEVRRRPLLARCEQHLEQAALALKKSALPLAYRRLAVTRLNGRLADDTCANIVTVGAVPARFGIEVQRPGDVLRRILA